MVLLSALWCGLVGCRCAPVEPPPPPGEVGDGPRHVVVVSFDTTRATALGPYGDRRALTPAVDRLADEGVVFGQHTSTAPSTLASHTSLMTGTWAHTHGVPKNGFLVHDDNRMLAEVLREQGFETAAFLAAAPLAVHSGFPQGFDHVDGRFDEQGDDTFERDAEAVTDAALAWLDDREPARRLFLFVHYFDPHAPYRPPEPYRSQRGELSEKAGSASHVARARSRHRQGRSVREQTVEELRATYLGEVSWTDHHFGRLLEGLREGGIYEDALIVLTADHGESENTHWEGWDHGKTLYDEVIRTPLVVRFPGGAGGGTRVDRPVTNIDVFPTVLELLELPAPEVDGLSLLTALRGTAPADRPIFSEATRQDADGSPWFGAMHRKAVRVGDFKLHLDPATGGVELYDLATDPGEVRDLTLEPMDADTEARIASMRALIDAWAADPEPLPSRRVSASWIRRQLEALGYIGD